MPDITTPAPAGTPTTTADQENWQERYLGLQRIVAKRDEALHTSTAQLDALRAEHEAAAAEIAAFRQRDADATEEESARSTYENLRERFEPTPPTPSATNPARGGDWTDASAKYAERERTGTDSGFPT